MLDISRWRPEPGAPVRQRPQWLPPLGGIVVFAISVSLLGALLLMASVSVIAALAAIGCATLLLVLLSMGLVETATIVIVLAMFFAPLNDVRPSSAASFVTAADVLFVLGFGLLAPVIAFRRITPPLIFVIGSVVLLAMGLLASLGSADSGLSLNAMTRLVVAALGLPVAFMLWRPGIRTVVWLAAAYLAGGVASVSYAVYEGPAANDRYDGLATHPNFFGLSALLAVSLVPFIANFTPRPRRWLPWAAGAVCLYGIWISGSRASLVVVLLLALVYPVLARSIMAGGLLVAGGVVLLVASDRLLPAGGEDAFSRLRGNSTSDYSDTQRERLITQGIKSLRDHPLLGRGLADALESHNIYLEIAVAVGLIGAAGYILILLATVSPMFTLAKPFNQLAYPAFAYALVGFIINSLWDRFIWAALALSLLARLLAEDEEANDTGPPEQHAQHREAIAAGSSRPGESVGRNGAGLGMTWANRDTET